MKKRVRTIVPVTENLSPLQRLIKLMRSQDWYFQRDNNDNIVGLARSDSIEDSETEMAIYEWENDESLHEEYNNIDDYVDSQIHAAFANIFISVRGLKEKELENKIIESVEIYPEVKKMINSLIHDMIDAEHRQWVGPMIAFGAKWKPPGRNTTKLESQQIRDVFREFGKKSKRSGGGKRTGKRITRKSRTRRKTRRTKRKSRTRRKTRRTRKRK